VWPSGPAEVLLHGSDTPRISSRARADYERRATIRCSAGEQLTKPVAETLHLAARGGQRQQLDTSASAIARRNGPDCDTRPWRFSARWKTVMATDEPERLDRLASACHIAIRTCMAPTGHEAS